MSYTLSGADVGDPAFPNYLPPNDITVITGVITARQLSIAPPVLTAKIYDGNTTAVVTPGTLTGVISGDHVIVQAVATYNNAEVGTNKQVKIVYTLSGADAGNYIAPASHTVSTGEITANVQ